MIDHTFPLIDLHRHLDGNVRLETIIDLASKHNVELPAWTIEELRPFVQVMEPQPGVMAFIGKFEIYRDVLVDYDACRRVAYENIADAIEENIDYAELRFSPWFMAEKSDLNPIGVVEAVCDGIESGIRDYKVPVKIIGILSRTYGVEIAKQELKAILSKRDSIEALDLAGDEINFPAYLFVDHFRIARDHGLHITVHAGESSGSKSIWDSIKLLGATRIGHAVSAAGDMKLIDYMLSHGIGIECNLTSNLQTSIIPSYKKHPLKMFLDSNLLATINTDDPGISGIDLIYEYNVAAPMAGLDCEQIRKAQRNALKIAFLSEEDKTSLILKKQNLTTKYN
jgi:adenosine deaminase